MDGKIIKGIAGFYYIYAADGNTYECKAKGIFRKDNRKPLVGDDVKIDIISKDPPVGNIVQLCERRNELIRPAVANVDQAIIIFAVKNPEPNYNILDRFLIMMSQQNIPCLICMNKADLISEEEQEKIRKHYEGAGCEMLFTSVKKDWNIDVLRERLQGKTTTVAGPSGVGKSSLVNKLVREEIMETGDLSQKVKRGKNTTRHTFLMTVDKQTFIMDTPGFTSLGMFLLEKEMLRHYYPEFEFAEGRCRFQGCVHVNEPDCRVKESVEDGKISSLRYENYKMLYEELKNQKRY